MDREIAQEYVNYRVGKGWTLLQIAKEHKIPVRWMERPYYFKQLVEMKLFGNYTDAIATNLTDYIVDNIARQHAQLNR